MSSPAVQDLLADRPLRSVTGSSTVAAACHRMREHRVGALAVFDGMRLTGILSERDISVRVIAGHHDPMLTLVREVMTRQPRTVPAHTPASEALRIMLEGGFRHLPVTRGESVVGMVSLRDVSAEGGLPAQGVRAAEPVLALG